MVEVYSTTKNICRVPKKFSGNAEEHEVPCNAGILKRVTATKPVSLPSYFPLYATDRIVCPTIMSAHPSRAYTVNRNVCRVHDYVDQAISND